MTYPPVTPESIERRDAARAAVLEHVRGMAERSNALRDALDHAATSLETISRLAGRPFYGNPPIETYMETPLEIRGYAAARAGVAREAIDAARKEQE